MKLAFCCVLSLSCALSAAACGSDSKDEPSASAGKGGGDGGSGANTAAGGAPNTSGGGGTPGAGDACEVGCTATLAADCSNGPATHAKCVSDCHMLEAGSCGGEYATFQACAEGNPITCTAQGQPVVEACSDEQAAFIACLPT
jgi:hypothetical protein